MRKSPVIITSGLCNSRVCPHYCWAWIVTSAEEGGYVFGSVRLSVCLSLCLSVCPSDYSQTCERILTKFFGGVGHGSRTKWYNFGHDPDHASNPGVQSPKSRSSGSAEVCALWVLFLFSHILQMEPIYATSDTRLLGPYDMPPATNGILIGSSVLATCVTNQQSDWHITLLYDVFQWPAFMHLVHSMWTSSNKHEVVLMSQYSRCRISSNLFDDSLLGSCHQSGHISRC